MLSQQPRYDIYVNIHKALRAQMSHTLITLGRLDWRVDEEVAAVAADVRSLLDVCLNHLNKENRYVHSAMEARRPGSTQPAVIEHVQHEQEIERLSCEAFALEHLSAPRREQATLRLYRDLSRFVGENFEHMLEEELEHNQVLWETHTDEEIHAIEVAIVSSMTPEQSQNTLRWMLPALNPVERARFLSGMRQAAPAEVFDGVMNMLSSLLGAVEWERLQRDLHVSAQVAQQSDQHANQAVGF